MATTHPTPETMGHATDAGSHNRLYVAVAIFLAILTALEVATYWAPKDLQHTWYFAAGLCLMMTIKFVTVTLFFMHLKFDKRLLTIAFYSALVLALSVYIAVLAAFRFWPTTDHMIT
jgi:caa(3)-type oxidase subunit IV